MKEKIVLIDGHSILNRAFYGIPDLTNSSGFHTNAIYGFLNIMFKILSEEAPQYLTVAFDVSAPTFRHELFKEYKGTRKPMPQELREQVPVIKDLLKAMRINIIEKAGYEADDLLGTISKQSSKQGFEVSVISGDRDLLQLAEEDIKIRIPKTKRGTTEIEDYNAKDVLEAYQVTPLQIIELKALMGDTADNIPGVPGIGEKTATKIIVEYGNIENAFAHADEIKPNKAREALMENYDKARLSKTLATIDINCDIQYSIENAKLGNIYTDQAYQMFKELEFKNLLNRFDAPVNDNTLEEVFKTITMLDEAENIMNQAKKCDRIGIQMIVDKERLIGTSIALSETQVYFIVAEGFITTEYIADRVNEILNSSISISTIGLKEQLRILQISDINQCFDVEIGAYLLNPMNPIYPYSDLAKEYLGFILPEREELLGKLSYLDAYEQKPQELSKVVCYMSYVALMSAGVIEDRLKAAGEWDLFKKIEMPLIVTLHDMETTGIAVEKDELKEYGNQLSVRIIELEKQIYQLSGEEFNINSPKQLGEILFGKLGLPNGKKTKTGYSTAADVLEKLEADYEIVALILEYRQLTKLKSTYADGLANYIEADGRIHSNFNQTITATGRISSTEPNLQNIPIRMELGRLIRKVFIPKEDYVFVDADYSQIELRVLAHFSGDKKLIQAYREEQDIHKITASEVFHTPLEEVTSLQRRNAKAVNFGIVYGISSFGLSQDLSISRKEASEYIEKYFETYPRVKEFLDEAVMKAKQEGYSTTIFGRIRPIPELKSSNFMQRSFGERVAMNAPIQGTAADIIKIAMIRVNDRLKSESMKSKLILQVHDELLIEAHKDEIDKVKEILNCEMHGAANLLVPLEIDMSTGNNWYETK
ncbi:DNA polymerase I [Lachnotalea glycerini]|uniref:DNA polymerase I n=1 Tax=Lachnotalea glycerini TaxID=1763509 RepID=A0A255I6Y7_9FIRM|nr:DNA polymerase I [Lachnotalea glycerini]PXV95956.1 DNA polymerase I [Lachnotalea glycerini]RDY32997.1 DNA polymerase I [Lachnotalea glycerini]